MSPKTELNRILYKKALKPILFGIDPEQVHNHFTSFGSFLGKHKLTYWLTEKVCTTKKSPFLKQKLLNITFDKPIGLAAGFDYDGRLTEILPALDFGFHTVGTVTAGSYQGNVKPRLGRLPKSKSLLVNKGFKSQGVHKVIARLKTQKQRIPMGVSVGATNKKYKKTSDQVAEYLKTLIKLEKSNLASFYEINVSCPNLKSGEPFTTPSRLRSLLKEIEQLKLKRPLFIKMPCDKTKTEVIKLVRVAEKFSISGLIFGNLTKDRNNPDLNKKEVAIWKGKIGNFSGKPTQKRSDDLLLHTYKTFGKRFVLVGCGGVFNAEDAYEKIKRGASLIQLITGMIFEGPQLISEINQTLPKLLKADGFSHISQAVGLYAKKNT